MSKWKLNCEFQAYNPYIARFLIFVVLMPFVAFSKTVWRFYFRIGFNEIAKATDTDGILRSSRDKQLVCMMKDQWWFGGRNPRTVAYIQRRINEISRMSPMSFNMVLRSCAKDLIEFGNFFLYLHRQNKFSSGKPTEINAKRVDPIAAIHPVDVTTMRPVLGDTVEIRSWIQTLESPSLMSSRISRLDYTTPDRNSFMDLLGDVRDLCMVRRPLFLY